MNGDRPRLTPAVISPPKSRKVAKGPKEKTSARGYGAVHQRLRKLWEARIRAGDVRCARGAACIFAVEGVPGLIKPGDPWDLGHDDRDRSVYVGPEHRRCNRRTSAHKAQRRQRRSRDW